MDSLNDPEAVRKAYADENRYATRMAKQKTATGSDPYDIVFAAVKEALRPWSACDDSMLRR